MSETQLDRYRAALQREINIIDRGELVPPELAEEIAEYEAQYSPERLDRLLSEALEHVSSETGRVPLPTRSAR